MQSWQFAQWFWLVVAIAFLLVSPVFVPFAIRSREARKDIGLALSFSVVCWLWVGAIAYFLVTFSIS